MGNDIRARQVFRPQNHVHSNRWWHYIFQPGSNLKALGKGCIWLILVSTMGIACHTLKQKQEQEQDRWQERDLGSAEKNFTGAGILVHNMAARSVLALCLTWLGTCLRNTRR